MKTLTTFLLLALSGQVLAGGPGPGDTLSMSENRIFKKIDNHLENYEVDEADRLFNALTSRDQMSAKAHLEYGMFQHRFKHNWSAAIQHVEIALTSNSVDSTWEVLFALGESYQMFHQPDRAKKCYRQVLKRIAPEAEDLKRDVEHRMEQCDYVVQHPEIADKDIRIFNLGPDVNGAWADYVPVANYRDTSLLFTSRRKTPGNKIDQWDGFYFEDMFVTQLGSDGFVEAQEVGGGEDDEAVKNTKFHDAPVFISHDMSKMYFYGDNVLYVAEWDDSKQKWGKSQKMPEQFQYGEYRNHVCSHPTQDIFYISAKHPEGKGGLDIYKIVKNADGTYSEPEIMGDNVNTEYDEQSPFVSADGKYLYFSSNGHPSYGGYDFFVVSLEEGAAAAPQNLGQPWNSPANDLFLTFNSEENYGYFSSGRKDGFGDLDNYMFQLIGKGKTKCSSSDKVLVNAVDTSVIGETVVFASNIDLGADRVIERTIWKAEGERLDEEGSDLEQTYTEPGKYTVSLEVTTNCIECFGLETFCATKEVLVLKEPILPPDPDTPKYVVELALTPVYFDFDKFNVRRRAKPDLDANISKLKDHDDVLIRLTGHTDSRGDSNYNMRLSERRLKSVVRYLKRNGVDEARIIASVAHGETKLVNNCNDTNSATCTIRQHQLNRRVEFELVKEK